MKALQPIKNLFRGRQASSPSAQPPQADSKPSQARRPDRRSALRENSLYGYGAAAGSAGFDCGAGGGAAGCDGGGGA